MGTSERWDPIPPLAPTAPPQGGEYMPRQERTVAPVTLKSSLRLQQMQKEAGKGLQPPCSVLCELPRLFLWATLALFWASLAPGSSLMGALEGRKAPDHRVRAPSTTSTPLLTAPKKAPTVPHRA